MYIMLHMRAAARRRESACRGSSTPLFPSFRCSSFRVVCSDSAGGTSPRRPWRGWPGADLSSRVEIGSTHATFCPGALDPLRPWLWAATGAASRGSRCDFSQLAQLVQLLSSTPSPCRTERARMSYRGASSTGMLPCTNAGRLSAVTMCMTPSCPLRRKNNRRTPTICLRGEAASHQRLCSCGVLVSLMLFQTTVLFLSCWTGRAGVCGIT